MPEVTGGSAARRARPPAPARQGPPRRHRCGAAGGLRLRCRPGDVVMDVGAATGAVGLMVAEKQRKGASSSWSAIPLSPNSAAETAGTTMFRERSRSPTCSTRPRAWRQGLQSERRHRADQPALPGRGAGANLPGQGPGGGPCPAGRRPRIMVEGLHGTSQAEGPAGPDPSVRTGSPNAFKSWRHGWEASRIRFVHPDADRPAIRFLLSGVKGSRAPLTILPPLVLNGPDGRFTSQAEALHRGEAILL